MKQKVDFKFLYRLLKCKSISTDGKHMHQLEKAKYLIGDHLKSFNFDCDYIGENKSVIYASRILNKRNKTILIYSHYDVQPAEEEGWLNNPFIPILKNNNIYARGVADNKAQLFIYLESIKNLIKTSELENINILFLIEGEEEIGSPTLKQILKQGQIKEKIDQVIISDTYMVAPNQPTIVTSFRGNISFEIVLKTAKYDVHSGIYGGGIHNAAQNIMELHTKIFTPDFVKILDSGNTIKNNKKFIAASSAYEQSLQKDIKNFSLSSKYKNVSKLTSLYSSLEIIGMVSGYINEGIKNVIPHNAVIKYNYRFAHGSKAQKIINLIENRFNKICKKYKFNASLIIHRISDSFLCNVDEKSIDLLSKISNEIYSKNPIFKAEGGSISILNYFGDYVTRNMVLFGFADLNSNIHSVNENINVKNIELGIKFVTKLLQEYK